ncbi:hypothetical protein ACFLRU_04435 [Bacteroidota bacterium]
MKAASLREIKLELIHCNKDELLELCLRLSKFKKENKELLTYLLFEASNEEGFVETVKSEVDELFSHINTNSYFYMKKTIRKVLRVIKTNIRYSKNKETEVELLLYFCECLKDLKPSIKYSMLLKNLYKRELLMIEKKVGLLHEDLQYDYQQAIDDLKM